MLTNDGGNASVKTVTGELENELLKCNLRTTNIYYKGRILADFGNSPFF